MNQSFKTEDSQGDWTFIAPIGNLTLTDAVNYEFRIDRVFFVAREKLPRIRKRLGINTRISEIKNSVMRNDFFQCANAFAVVRHKGKPSELRDKCLNMVRDELSILAVSKLGYNRRRSTGYLSLFGEHEPGQIRHMFFNKNDSSTLLQHRLTKSPQQLVLGGRWKKFQKQILFFNLLKILRKEINVSREWRDDLRKAAILVGRSMNSNDVPTSFLWNMVALELLLTRSNEKYLSNLPKRVEAFLGWVSPAFKENIPEVYKKRSALVHSGDRNEITIEHLLFTDSLILNLLMNLVNFPKRFGSKEMIIEFAEKVEAEQKLGLKSKVRPKFKFLSQMYSKDDYSEI